ncbi:hypothetical protein [Cerasicoccus maritimus]|uniref:hypothetical protein n=1 Tax=Cerasicoccus maritimus TaxID=490089 RepID=UPI0028526184|nr:hypothetical protein [Cerasicoccus maritimus]
MRMPLIISTCLTVGALFFTACGDEPEKDIEATPVGSVLTGETETAEGYLKKVEEGNKARQQEQAYESPYDREEPGRTGLTDRY